MALLADDIALQAMEEAQFDVVASIGRVPKYRIMPQVLMIAGEISEGPVLPAIPYPHDPKWLEFAMRMKSGEDVRFGLLLGPEGGYALVQSRGAIEGALVKWSFGVLLVDRPSPSSKAVLEGAMRIFAVVLSMIENPQLLERNPVTIDAPLQRARVKRGKPPLFDHSEVTVHVTRQEREARAVAESEIRAGRKLHFVRMFHRVRNGKVERVREHWRGDAGRGMKLKPTRYRVTV